MNHKTWVTIARKIPALLIAGAIWLLSSQSVLPTPKGILGFDKLQHLLAYGALAVAIGPWFSLKQWKTIPGRCMVLVIMSASAYGVSDEIHQYFVPGRDCNGWDWLADTLGACGGAGLVMVIARKLRI
ncbi:MAG: VanZ family protein [Treponema sp.]|jgi:VanZ family protein|nr:VanZ family protein [Treponema sp.]